VACYDWGMRRLLVNWLLSAVALLVVAHVVPGFHVAGFGAALVASLVIGLINGTLGIFLKLVTAPLSVITLGGFLIVINALMLMFASSILRGFEVRGFIPALIGAIALSLTTMVLRWLLGGSSRSAR
jgi:putative membrane protein